MKRYVKLFVLAFLAISTTVITGAGCDSNLRSQVSAPQQLTVSASSSYSGAPATATQAPQEQATEEPVKNPFPTVFHTTLAFGSSGTDVANLQQFLVLQGIYPGEDTGIFDRTTRNAVLAFEIEHNLTPINGVFGPREQAFANIIVWDHPDWLTTLSNDTEYKNVNGSEVHSPAYSTNGVPAGASARCGDGTYSFSMNHRGTCSHHGGVEEWY